MKKLALQFGPMMATGFVVMVCEYIFESPKPFLFLSPDVENLLLESMKINKKSFKNVLSATLKLEIFDPVEFEKENILTADWIKEAFAKVMKHREANRNPGTGPP